MNHLEVADLLSQQMERGQAHLALILFGSVARGEARPGSDLDFLLLHKNPRRKFWEEEIDFRGIKVGINHLDYGHFKKAVMLQPFNRIVLTTAQVMFDKTDKVNAWIDAVKRYFMANPDIKEEWDKQEALYRVSKAQSSVKATNIKDLYLQFAFAYRGRVLQEVVP